MQYKNTVEAIYISLEEIQNLVSEFGAEEEIHRIDIDLATEKVRRVYDLLLSLRNEVGDLPLETKMHVEKAFEKHDGSNVEFEFNTVDESSDIHNETEGSTIQTDSVKEIKEEPEKLSEPAPKSVQPDLKVSLPEEKKFLGESLGSKKPTLNEELSGKSKDSQITEKLKTKPISSISGSIGLNEKFEFINNLFRGDKARYEHAMEVLNSATNFNDAYDYLANSLNWDMDSVYAQRILDLIRRKLIVRKNEQ
ncbi:MAG: hypothetical protein JXA77_14050 [Bacteroidales bacterium]|nr:hypothetical protein [Bacteroidales bacterium]MBN2819226.1 hypothetical protein [Bacteroidales bacterium]